MGTTKPTKKGKGVKPEQCIDPVCKEAGINVCADCGDPVCSEHAEYDQYDLLCPKCAEGVELDDVWPHL